VLQRCGLAPAQRSCSSRGQRGVPRASRWDVFGLLIVGVSCSESRGVVAGRPHALHTFHRSIATTTNSRFKLLCRGFRLRLVVRICVTVSSTVVAAVAATLLLLLLFVAR
jgi:hypothetical protein